MKPTKKKIKPSKNKIIQLLFFSYKHRWLLLLDFFVLLLGCLFLVYHPTIIAWGKNFSPLHPQTRIWLLLISLLTILLILRLLVFATKYYKYVKTWWF